MQSATNGPQTLHGSIRSIYSFRILTLMRIRIHLFTLIRIRIQLFKSQADPSPTSQNIADPDPQHWHKVRGEKSYPKRSPLSPCCSLSLSNLIAPPNMGLGSWSKTDIPWQHICKAEKKRAESASENVRPVDKIYSYIVILLNVGTMSVSISCSYNKIWQSFYDSTVKCL